MAIKIKILSVWLIIFAIASFSMTGTSFAQPNLATGIVIINADKNECIKRAKISCQTELVGPIRITEKYILKWNSSDATVIIHCWDYPDRKSIAFIAVTSYGDPRYIRDVLYDGINLGGPHE